jgi:hypothetical protein
MPYTAEQFPGANYGLWPPERVRLYNQLVDRAVNHLNGGPALTLEEQQAWSWVALPAAIATYQTLLASRK